MLTSSVKTKIRKTYQITQRVERSCRSFSMITCRSTCYSSCSSFLIVYRQKYRVKLPKEEMNESFIDYESLCTVIIHAVIRDPRVIHKDGWGLLNPKPEEVINPEPGEVMPPREYRIHAGYRRVLAGFIREIEFTTVDKVETHDCVFRGIYLIKILDHFAEELAHAPPNSVTRFRSRVLNPLLQRRL